MRSLWIAFLLLMFAAAADAQTCSALSLPPLPANSTLADADGATISYEDVVAGWFTGVKALPIRICPNGVDQCLLVPKYGDSSTCDLDYGICNRTSTNGTQGCQVTDEFSQVGMALAMSSDTLAASRFNAWYNTLLTMMATVTNSTDQLPSWVQSADWTGSTMSISITDSGDASDATARIIIALYIAADSSFVTTPQRAAYLAEANRLAAAFAAHDYARTTITVRGRRIAHWLASGWPTARNYPGVICMDADCPIFGYAGYYGDAAIAMLAAYAHTLDSSYLTIASDTIRNYLVAADWQPGTFRVPPTAFIWRSASGDPPLTVSCSKDCDSHDGEDAWDAFDAPRAVSICKSAYYARLLDLPADPAIQSYCTDWMATGALSYGTTPLTYIKRFTVTGTAFDSAGVADSYYNNSFGVFLNFFCGTDELDDRLKAIYRNKYRVANRRFDGDSCFGVYTQAFPVIDYGSAIGRDETTFQRAATPTTLTAMAGNGTVALSWTTVAGAASYEVWRRASGAWLLVTTTPSTSYNDARTNGTAHLYRVRAVYADTTRSLFSNDDLATPFAFTDDPLVPGSTRVRASHVTQMRAAVDAVQQLAGIVPTAYTNPTVTAGATRIRAVHISELRSRLDAARAALALPALSYTHTVTSGSPIRAGDVTEVRNGTR